MIDLMKQNLIVLLFLLHLCWASILQIPWMESVDSEVDDYVVKSQFWEINGFIQLVNEEDYFNIHRRIAHQIDSVLYCYLNNHDLIDLPTDKYDQTRLFTGVSDYLLLTRLYYMASDEESRLLYQFPEGKFSNVLIFSLENEIQTWKLVLTRLNDLKEFSFPRDEVRSCLECIQAYEIIASRVLTVLEDILKKQNSVCSISSASHNGDDLSNEGPDKARERVFHTLLSDKLQIEINSLNWDPKQDGPTFPTTTIKFVQGFLSHYRLSSLDPYLFSFHFCIHQQPYITIYEELLNREETISIVHKCTSLPVNKKSQILDIVQYFRYRGNMPDRIELNSYEWCMRKLTVLSDSLPSLKIKSDKDASARNDIVERFFSCPIVDRLSPSRCIPTIHLQNHYHQSIIQALFASPEALIQGIPVKSKTSKPSSELTGKVLIAGGLTSGAELNTYLVTKFKWLEIEHIDYKDYLIKLMKSYFQFEPFGSETTILKNEIDIQTSTKGESVVSTRYYLDSQNSTKLSRSRIIQADFYEYLFWKNQQMHENESYLKEYLRRLEGKSDNETAYIKSIRELRNKQKISVEGKPFIDLFYDYIIIDHLDANNLFNKENQDSNPIITDMLRLSRTLLRPFTGLLVLHVKKDEALEERLAGIIDVFGQSQIVFFDVSRSDLVVAAARDRYESLSYYGDDGAVLDEFPEYHFHELYRKQPHPCNSGLESIQRGKQLGKRLKLEGYHQLFTSYALNCIDAYR